MSSKPCRWVPRLFKKMPPPRTLQWAYAYGPTAVPVVWLFFKSEVPLYSREAFLVGFRDTSLSNGRDKKRCF